MKEQQKHLLDQVRACMTDKGIGHGLDESALRARFRYASETEFASVLPLWDLSESAKQKNDVVPRLLDRCVLFSANPPDFLSACRNPGDYHYGELWRWSNERNLLRVLGLWLRGIHLPPPVFDILENGDLLKIDGHHRTAAAVLSKRPGFIFYAPPEASKHGSLARLA